jgi:PAS domain S-box-containing protein
MDDAVYSSRVAVDHVHSGVAWIGADGKIGSVNQSLADSIRLKPSDLVDRDWYSMFSPTERGHVKEAYTQMILAGIASIETAILRADNSSSPVKLRIVAVHNRRMRLVGHHCMIHDQAQQSELERRISELSEALAQAGYRMIPVREESVWAQTP